MDEEFPISLLLVACFRRRGHGPGKPGYLSTALQLKRPHKRNQNEEELLGLQKGGWCCQVLKKKCLKRKDERYM
ncbi:hypothetical protein SDJN02_11665, partial [Cucurbita argyrosperma subsp. argyrosperma]